jgi:hypothetical protein
MRWPGNAQAPTPGTRPPEYVIELWVSDQIIDRIRRAPATPAVPAPEPPPARAEQELEAEP